MNPSPRVILSLAACSACGLYDISDKFDGESETAATTHVEVDPSTGDLATSTSTATTTSSTGTSTSAGSSTSAPWDTSTSSSSTSTTEDPPPPGPEVAPRTCSNALDTSWVFVTPFRVYGDLSPEGNVDPGIAAILQINEWSLTRADKVCQYLAQQANLAGRYVAWLSAGTNNVKLWLEEQETVYKRQFIRTDGVCVAADWDTWLSPNHEHPINRTHTNVPILSGRLAWTGTWEHGPSTGAHCDSWSTNDDHYLGRAGETDSTSKWSRADNASHCNTPLHLYCLQYAD